MGSQEVQGIGQPTADRIAPSCAVMQDLRALERMIADGLIEEGPARIGAEQELLLVDRHLAPAPVAAAVIERLPDPRFTIELARFNLEANATPRLLAGASLSGLWAELEELTARARAAAEGVGADVVLSGYLPTCHLPDAGPHQMTPGLRYEELARSAMEPRAGCVPVALHGTDSLTFSHDSIMIEGPATSFQVHLQVAPSAFPAIYNGGLLAAAPVLAAAVNSPLVCGRRLWHESRIPLIEAATDVRRPAQLRRPGPPRTSFGDGWVERSVVELFERDLLRHPPFLEPCTPESSLEVLEAGGIPTLRALTTFNGTVWRWLRPCYGITNGRPHLRIENRFLAAGPTVADEIANAALLIGLLHALPLEYGDIRWRIDFADVQANFYAAAQSGLEAQLRWLDGERISARDLLNGRLLALAWDGLRSAGVARSDVSRALEIVEKRVRSGRTGAQWALEAFEAVPGAASGCERAWRVTDAMVRHCWSGRPVHEWPVAAAGSADAPGMPPVTVALHTDLCTVLADAPVCVAELLMKRRGTSQVVIEDSIGSVVGLLRASDVTRWREAGAAADATASQIAAGEAPIVLAPSAPIDEALAAMHAAGQRCAVVLRGDKLAGVVEAEELSRLVHRLEGGTTSPAAASPDAPADVIPARAVGLREAARLRLSHDHRESLGALVGS